MEVNSKLKIDKQKLSKDSSGRSAPQPPLLPRDAWESKAAFLKVFLRVKQALDRIEQQVN